MYTARVRYMPTGKYRGISFPRELVDKIEEYIKTHPEMGYKSLADFVTDSIREKCDQLKILTPAPQLPTQALPPIEHFNIDESGVRILDRTLANHVSKGRIIDVYFKPDKVWCEYCESAECYHVKFALSIPEVQRILSKKGWKVEG
jgi:hypothetical protein